MALIELVDGLFGLIVCVLFGRLRLADVCFAKCWFRLLLFLFVFGCSFVCMSVCVCVTIVDLVVFAVGISIVTCVFIVVC